MYFIVNLILVVAYSNFCYPVLMKDKLLSERIRTVRKNQEKTQKEFAEAIGMTQTSLSMIETGKIGVSNKTVKVICTTYNINEEWLRTGCGEMHMQSPREKEFLEIFRSLAPETQQYILSTVKGLLVLQQSLRAK